MEQLLAIFFSTMIINNFVLAKMLGLCPFLGITKKLETSLGMGMAVTFVIALSGVISWIIDKLILYPFDVIYLRTIVYILVIAALVQLVETVMKKMSPVLYQALGIYLPLITTNCVVLGVVLLILAKGYNFMEMLVYSIGAPIGFTLALIIMAGIRENLALAKIPKHFQGVPIALITTGILALAFLGFSGMIRE